MDHQTTGRVKFPRTVIALEVLGFLMLQQHLLIFKLSLAVPTPRLQDESLLLGLLLAHDCGEME